MEERATGSTAAIGLGSNLGDRAARLHEAVERLRALPRTQLVAASAFIETEPLPRPDAGDPGGPYLNAAVILRTQLCPRDLLEALLAIERDAGRTRAADQRWAARTLDLDLLVYGDRVIDEPGLTLPHPRLHERPFVLLPLAEIAPNLPVPGPHAGRTPSELLKRLRQEASA